MRTVLLRDINYRTLLLLLCSDVPDVQRADLVSNLLRPLHRHHVPTAGARTRHQETDQHGDRHHLARVGGHLRAFDDLLASLYRHGKPFTNFASNIPFFFPCHGLRTQQLFGN